MPDQNVYVYVDVHSVILDVSLFGLKHLVSMERPIKGRK